MASFSLNKKRTYLEVTIVLALSLGASALYSIVDVIDFLTTPKGIGGAVANINPTLNAREWLDLTYQLLRIVLGFAPVALVLYLLSQTKPVLKTFGTTRQGWLRSSATGLALTAVIGIPGIGLYLLARTLKLSAKVVASDLQNHWWSIPVLLLAAASASLLEETIVIGYLFDRLGGAGWRTASVIWFSAVLRGSYHLYQGFGGFAGNLVMGLAFGWLYKRTGKLLPLLVAHFLLDAFSFVGYPLVAHLLP